MCSTRSPSRRAPAIKDRAIIVSHGQPSDPAPAEAALAGFAAQVARALPGWQIESATLANPGALDRAFQATGPGAAIYPLFMTGGWFTSDALQKRIAARSAHVLPPFGQDSGLPEMAARMLQDVLAEHGWQAADTRLFIAAHGSGRSDRSACDTQDFAHALARHLAFAEMRVGFVEESPYLADMAFGLGEKSICLPFFAAAGGHVQEDIPEALTLADFKGICLDPIGCAPQAPALVAQALTREKVTA